MLFNSALCWLKLYVIDMILYSVLRGSKGDSHKMSVSFKKVLSPMPFEEVTVHRPATSSDLSWTLPGQTVQVGVSTSRVTGAMHGFLEDCSIEC